MPKTVMELKSMNLEKGHGATAKEIANCIGEDGSLDEKITKVSLQRFEEIMRAYKKESFKKHKEGIKGFISGGGKVSRDTNDSYLSNRYSLELTIEALEYGIFRIPGEKSGWEKADLGKKALMQYLIKIDSPHAEALSLINVDEPEEILTLDKFIDSKKNKVREGFFSYRGEIYSAERFDRIFSRIKKLVKDHYELFVKDEARRGRRGKLLLSRTQKINICTEEMNRQTEQRNKALEEINSASNYKAHYSHTLQQKHDYFHSK